jgi:hypothetical protein
MKPRLALSLGSAHLTAELIRPAKGRGVRSLFGTILGQGRPSASQGEQIAARIDLTCAITADLLPAAIEQALGEMKAEGHAAIRGIELVVQLGLAHAWIGLMVLKEMSATALTSSAHEAFTQAWVSQMLHLDPETQIIRSQILSDARTLLISCVDRNIFQSLQESALEHKLRFTSCRPAVMSAIASRKIEVVKKGRAAGTDATVVWMEAGLGDSRVSTVQLLHFRGNQLHSTWRGWVPPAAPIQAHDVALEGAVRRFQIHNSTHPGDALTRLIWRSSAPARVPAE